MGLVGIGQAFSGYGEVHREDPKHGRASNVSRTFRDEDSTTDISCLGGFPIWKYAQDKEGIGRGRKEEEGDSGKEEEGKGGCTSYINYVNRKQATNSK